MPFWDKSSCEQCAAIKAYNWNHFSRLILDTAYELTFYVALQNRLKAGCPKLYLTLVGGGVFGINRSGYCRRLTDRYNSFRTPALMSKSFLVAARNPRSPNLSSSITPCNNTNFKVAFRSRESKRQNWGDAETIFIDLNLGVRWFRNGEIVGNTGGNVEF